MSGGKKKSSFQITSVTTDYEGPGSPGGPESPALPVPTGPPPRLPNGEPNPEPGGKSTPRNGSPPPGAPASRFRVVKLPQGLGEPYRRGRWTCVDVYERDLEPPSFGRLLEGIRGASGGTGGRSLDSRLELASLGLGAPIPQPGLSQGPTSWLLPPPTSPGPQARSFTGGLGQLAVPGKAKVETPPLSASPPQQRPPEPGAGDSVGTSRAATPLSSLRVEVETRGSTAGTPPLSRTKDGALRLRMELVAPEEMGQVPPLDSRPSSPALYFFPDASLVHKSPDPFGAAAAQSLSLARSMLAISGHLDSDDDSGSGSLVGIDNKIEQAMVFFWKPRAKSTIVEHPDSEKTALKMEKASSMVETFKLVEPLTEAKVSRMGVFPKVADPCTLAKTTDGAKVELDRGSRSLLQLPRTAAKSVSTLMISALQSGWQMCSWKSSVSSTSVPSEIRTGSPLQSPEAEMLREVYLVLWAIRKQLRQLARRQERRRRHHHWAHTSPQPEPVQGLKKDASRGEPHILRKPPPHS
ncbi:sperm acrosome developmental regulator isoform X1 [Eptesicus fuscus]|uniref:sperm acrosome developmental regulator isoform X1 n=1 Tax=Eptesicus fuscus TaxID=29078 RepID=UPI002403FCDD|nr:sperm acrosome developmental regulator isoform X1 [Eptesicus fuscus]